MTANYVLIQEITLNANAASVTFSNIPQTGYTDLKIVSSARASSNTSGGSIISFNGSSANMTTRGLYGSGSGSAASYNASNSLGNLVTQSVNTANTFANSELYIPNYASSAFKSSSMDGVTENNAVGALAFFNANLWSQTAAITSITLTPESLDSYVAGSSFSLYGIAALGTTPVTVPKASGGDIINTDGTYWYHTFLASGTFIPNQSLTCDYLVVAGGGAGGVFYGGGAGAGGYRTSIGGSPLSLTAQNYAVTVGAGGSAGVQDSATNGNNSAFSTITSTGGGKGGGYSVAAGVYRSANTGGSGGGGGGDTPTGAGAAGNTPSTSPSQGNNGGNGVGSPNNTGGGGGGSSAVGTAGNGSVCGNGGNGTSNSISGSAVTYAGGGGGGGAGGTTNGSGGTGGGGAGGGVSGTVNTGGGGGGGSGGSNGGSGGSGIVIVRYTVA